MAAKKAGLQQTFKHIQDTFTNRIYTVRLTKYQNAKWNKRDFRSLKKSIGVSCELNAGR